MPSMGCTPKYYPSTAFLPSVALGTLLTTNYVVVLMRAGTDREFREFREFSVNILIFPNLPNLLNLSYLSLLTASSPDMVVTRITPLTPLKPYIFEPLIISTDLTS